jgi:ElaB/YqjD/DUF883 family membrane-anchored ribosome-binding protein
MLTTHPSSVVQKRDLHVGGVGAAASGALAAVSDPVANLADTWLDTARDMAQAADDFVHENPWAALGVVALMGIAAGFVLSRRYQP